MKIIKKIILSVFLGVISLFLVAMTSFIVIVQLNNMEKGTNITVLNAKAPTHSKALVVFQPSLMSNSTQNVAYSIAEGLNKAGYDVTISYPNKQLSSDISSYDVLVFGSPIYIGQPSGALKSYINRIHDNNKKTLIFVTGANDDSEPLNNLGKLFSKINSFKKSAFKYNDSQLENKAFNLGYEFGK